VKKNRWQENGNLHMSVGVHVLDSLESDPETGINLKKDTLFVEEKGKETEYPPVGEQLKNHGTISTLSLHLNGNIPLGR
jgi:hypothetical protein